jgi:UDP-N-acetylglucosamine 2-epimerase (non-hydrolysing)
MAYVLAAVLTVNFHPFLETVALYKVEGLELFLICAALYAFKHKRDGVTGFLVVTAAGLKYLPGILILYFLVKREWRVVRGMLAACALYLLILLPIFGAETLWRYVTYSLILLFGHSLQGTAAWASLEFQTLTGTVMRWFAGLAGMQENLSMQRWAPVPHAQAAFLIAGVLKFLLAGLYLSLIRRRWRPEERGARWLSYVYELSLTLIMIFVISPISLIHYAILLLPAFVMVGLILPACGPLPVEGETALRRGLRPHRADHPRGGLEPALPAPSALGGAPHVGVFLVLLPLLRLPAPRLVHHPVRAAGQGIPRNERGQPGVASMTARTVAIVMGTRPDAIKMAPVVLKCLEHRDQLRTTVVLTAQHREMLDQVLEVFGIQPDVDLNLMRENQRLGDLTARLLTKLETLWRKARPDLVLVQGDTTSSFAAALAAYYLKIPIGHVEAGLRTQDKYAPFPEEMNRRLIDALADACFAPTPLSRENLLREGIPERLIHVTGNTGIDALLYTLQRVRENGFVPAELDPAVFDYKKLVLVTAHRRESFGDGFQYICQGLKTLARARPDVAIVYPVHPNPNVRQPVREHLRGVPNIYLTVPLGYRSFVYVMGRADVILTDSGGIQEEAPSLGKPVLVMREATERIEAIQAGVSELVGTQPSRIVERTTAMLEQPKVILPGDNPFGDGHAAERIVRVIVDRNFASP